MTDRGNLVAFAESYLANNAAETGTDELIRQFIQSHKLLDSQLANCHREIFALRDEVARTRAETIDTCSDALGLRREYLPTLLKDRMS